MPEFHSYTPAEGHNLRFSPFKALVAPRPIGWISSLSADGVPNLAPYSFFNAFCEKPAIIGFCSYGRKDSLTNIEATGEFVHNLVSGPLADAMNQTSGDYPPDISEIDMAGLETIPSEVVAPPRVAASPATMECKLIETKVLHGVDKIPSECTLVLGEVVRIHINTSFLQDGVVDEEALALVGRLGGFNYAKVSDVFAIKRPKV